LEIGSADAQGTGGGEGGHISYTCGLKLSFVMPALVAGIHVFLGCEKGVDGRVKPGHDD